MKSLFAMRIFALLVVTLTVQWKRCFSNTIEVSTKVGKIIGKMSEVVKDNQTYLVKEYLGVPFAKAPVGNLRFRKPERKAIFREPFNATAFGPICPQGGIEIVPLHKFRISEDCLVLNIFVPDKKNNGEDFAVMVYIHGGAFITGASNFYVSDVLSAYGNVIVVTVNYRLSIFGFLSTNDENARGNYGLWDQQLAIQWVHENIASFNGNPNKITLFGQSAGAISVIYQALYPGNIGLFQRVIAESGTPVNFGAANVGSALGQSYRNAVGQMTGCPYISSRDVLECLREKTTYHLIRSTESVFHNIEFVPVVDGEFILGDPLELLDKTKPYPTTRNAFSAIDLLIGGNSMEGAMYLTFMWKSLLLITDLHKFAVSPKQFKEKVVPKVLQQVYGRNVPKLAVDAVNIRYTDIVNQRDPIKVRDMLIQLSTDYAYRMPNLKTAILHEDLSSSKTYMYEFKASPTLTIGKLVRPKWVTEANHGDECAFVFGFSRRMLEALNAKESYFPTQEELRLSKTMMTAWTNFAKTGDPNSPFPVDGIPSWPTFSEFEAAYVEFDFNMSADALAKEGYGEPGGSFWLKFMPHVMYVANQLDQPAVACDNARQKSSPLFKNSVFSVVLVVLGICTFLLVLTQGVTCFCLRKKKKKSAKYDAVEI